MLAEDPNEDLTDTTTIPCEMTSLDSTGLQSLSFKFKLSRIDLLQAEPALTLSRKRYLTFLRTQTPATATYTYGFRCEFDPFNSPLALLSASLPFLSDYDELRGSKFGAFSNIGSSSTILKSSGGHRVFAWLDEYNDGEIKGVKLWSDSGPNYVREGEERAEGEDRESRVCTVKLPKSVAIATVESVALDEIHGRIFLTSKDASITILSFL